MKNLVPDVRNKSRKSSEAVRFLPANLCIGPTGYVGQDLSHTQTRKKEDLDQRNHVGPIQSFAGRNEQLRTFARLLRKHRNQFFIA